MENIKTLLLNLSTHNPQFTSVFKIGGIVKTFLEEYEALCASDSKDKDIFFNMKQLEVAYLEVFVGFENAFLAVNAVINLLAYHRRIKLPYLLVKGSVFGLNLFLAQSEADVFEHAQSQIIEYCKLIGLEELLLLCNPLRLNQVANKKPLIDHIRSSFQKTDDKAIKIMLKLIARFEMQDEPEVPALINAAVQNNHIELQHHFFVQ